MRIALSLPHFATLNAGYELDAFDGLKNIMKSMTDLTGHQKTRTAVRSISTLSMG